MLTRFNLSTIWQNVRELDLQRLRVEAEQEVHLAIAGYDELACRALAGQLRSDPRRPDTFTHTPVPLLQPEDAAQHTPLDLLLTILPADPQAVEKLQPHLETWARNGLRVVLVQEPNQEPLPAAGRFPQVRVDLSDWGALQRVLAPAIIDALPDRTLALGRLFPLLRETIAHRLISDTSAANAAYAFSTGLAEIVPILDIPLNIADIIVLTKAQALLVYKLGLALGLPLDWQYYTTEFGGVIGSGFLWRQVARSLVGLIPAWGIVPKVAVAYSGTYTVGQAVLYWYLSGKHATRKMLRGFMREAFARGKTLGRSLRDRLPSLRRRDAKLLDAGEIPLPDLSPESRKLCPHCDTINDSDARFCKHCGREMQERP